MSIFTCAKTIQNSVTRLSALWQFGMLFNSTTVGSTLIFSGSCFFIPLLELDRISLLTLAPPLIHSPLFIPTVETLESMAHQSKPHLKELQRAHLLETHCFPVLVSSTSPMLPLMDLYWITEAFLDTACTVIRHN